MTDLYDPITIMGRTFRNRVVMPPMVMNLGDTDGCVTDAVIAHYAKRAQAGVGLIIVEATAVAENGRCWERGLCAYADRHLPGLARLAEAIHAGGALAAIQLVHGGPQSSPALCGGVTLGPSAVPPSEGAAVPSPLTVDEIQAIEAQFTNAAVRVLEAGFDGVEIHGAHGFLLDSFISSRRNTRTDAYGGPIENRMCMLVETCTRVRDCIGQQPLLWPRISIFNHLAEGFSAEDLRTLVSGLDGTGINLLHISTDGAFKGYFGTDKPIGALVKEQTALPVIVAGRLGDPADARRAITEGITDLAAVGSAMLKDPDWAMHAREM